jgi:hypothetical protein
LRPAEFVIGEFYKIVLVGVFNCHWSKFLAYRESRKLVLIIVAIALLLDNMLLTTVGELTEYTQSGNGRFVLAYIPS